MQTLNLPDPELLAQAIEYLPDALVIVNHEGQIVLANRQTEVVFGHPRASLHGQPIEMLLPEPLRERHRQHFGSYAANPRVRPMGENLPLTAQGAGGQEFSVAINLAPLVTSGGTYFAAVIRRK